MRNRGRKLGLLFLAGLFATGLLGSVPTVATSSPESIVVTSTADSGPGSLRQALQNAHTGDTITFDTTVFPPSAPATIYLTSPLPGIGQGNLTIDASNASVILDGSGISGDAHGLSITSSGNVIRGLQVIRFSDSGIALSGGAQNNTIGGDRNIGAGPLGQGNLISGDGNFGVGLWDPGTSFNTIRGNYIGTDLSGSTAWGSARDGIHMNGANYNLVVDNLISGHGTGVYLCCVNDGSNTIRGNYIGTDASGGTGVGNRWAGVAIDRSGYNVVGPANVIAFNGGPGIAVYAEGSVRNRITQNSIHDNGGQGIELSDGGNTELAVPLLLDWDLAAGTAGGIACAGCVVEILSDGEDQGAVYEGRSTADGAGAFAFSKGAALAGPYLTVTATDAEGNTSEFSAPTLGTRRSMILQEANHLPRTQLQPRRSGELADNRIGGDVGSDCYGYPQSGRCDDYLALGLKWIRLGFDGMGSSFNWQRVEVAPGEYTIDSAQDNWVNDIVSNGVNIILNLGVGPGDGITGTRFTTEEEIERYLDYVRFMVRHFKDRVVYYELWNEPGGTTPATGAPAPIGIRVDIYANVIARAVPIIRQANPQAKIVIGALGGDWIFGFPGYGEYARSLLHIEYLRNLIGSGVMPLVDAISWHPFYGNRPDDPYYQTYPAFVSEIRELAASQGFDGEYFAEEIDFRSEATSEKWGQPAPVVSEKVAAKYYARAIVMHLGLDFVVSTAGQPAGTGPVSDITQALCTVMAGAEPASLSVEIQSEATDIKSYGFSLANGDRLFALWTDGVGADDDPGVKATLTLSGFSNQTVMGIDVLNGFEQQMITDAQGGNLVVRDLLVKDYPVILRLRPGVTTSLAQGWNGPCYLGPEQPIEQALADIITDVQAVYRLNSGQTFDRWFAARPEVSNIATIRPYEPLFVLMAKDAAWPQTPSSTPPTSVTLAQGWNSTCYLGQTTAAGNAIGSIASQLDMLYMLGSDQTWSRHVPGRPEVSNIAQLAQYDAVLVLVNAEGGAQWVFNP